MHGIKGKPGYLLDYLNESELTNNFHYIQKDKRFQAQSDIIRLGLLNKYGGVWIDISTILLKPIEDFCIKPFEKPAKR